MMRYLARPGVLLLLSLLSANALAQDKDPVLPDLRDTYTPAPPASDALYLALGGERGLRYLSDDFLARLLADRRLKPFFADIDHAKFKREFAAQVCQVSGGPCTHKPNNRRIHSAMDIRRRDFTAVVEVLQQAMEAQAIPFGVQNRLLALLAPMHRDIVNTD